MRRDGDHGLILGVGALALGDGSCDATRRARSNNDNNNKNETVATYEIGHLEIAKRKTESAMKQSARETRVANLNRPDDFFISKWRHWTAEI